MKKIQEFDVPECLEKLWFRYEGLCDLYQDVHWTKNNDNYLLVIFRRL